MEDKVEWLRSELVQASESPTPEALRMIAEKGRALTTKYAIGSLERLWLSDTLPTALQRLGYVKREFYADGMPGPIPLFLGRDEEKQQLDRWAEDANARVLVIVGPGGLGKTQLVNMWLAENNGADEPHHAFKAIFCWCFYTSPKRLPVSHFEFFNRAIRFFERVTGETKQVAPDDRPAYLADLAARESFLIVLDGLEALQVRPIGNTADDEGEPLQPGSIGRRFSHLMWFLSAFQRKSRGKLLVTSRQPVAGLQQEGMISVLQLRGLSGEDAIKVLRSQGVDGANPLLAQASDQLARHPLSLVLFGRALAWRHGGVPVGALRIQISETRLEGGGDDDDHPIVRSYLKWLSDSPELEFLQLLGFFGKRRIAIDDLRSLMECESLAGITSHLRKRVYAEPPSVNTLDPNAFLKLIESLRGSGLLLHSADDDGPDGARAEESTRIATYDCHPLLRSHFREELMRLEGGKYWLAGQSVLFDRYRQQVAGEAQNEAEALVLYESIGYACEADRFAEAFDVYWTRVHHNTAVFSPPNWYAWERLGLFADDLAALGSFYKNPWEEFHDRAKRLLDLDQQTMIRFATAECLVRLGYTIESGHVIGAIRASLERREQYKLAAIASGWECERRLLLGDFDKAGAAGNQALEFAKRSGDGRRTLSTLGRLADLKMQLGDWPEAGNKYKDVLAKHRELRMQSGGRDEFPIAGFTGYLYGDFVLNRCEILLANWDPDARFLRDQYRSKEQVSADLREVIADAEQIISADEGEVSVVDRHLHTFLLLRARAIRNIWLTEPVDLNVQVDVDQKLRELERSFEMSARSELPRLLLKRTKVLRRTAKLYGKHAATRDRGEDLLRDAHRCLDAAWDIANYGEMRLYEADIRLERSKVYAYKADLNRNTAQMRTDAARAGAVSWAQSARLLIEELRYYKRLPELVHLESWLEVDRSDADRKTGESGAS
jgi:hypothetical protein